VSHYADHLGSTSVLSYEEGASGGQKGAWKQGQIFPLWLSPLWWSCRFAHRLRLHRL